MSEQKIVDVAVGVLIREDGRVLLASRPAGKPSLGTGNFLVENSKKGKRFTPHSCVN